MVNTRRYVRCSCGIGRTTVFTKEVADGEEAPEPTEEEAEQGPEPLSTLDKDGEVEGGEAWTPVSSSTNSGVKNQVDQPDCSLTAEHLQLWLVFSAPSCTPLSAEAAGLSSCFVHVFCLLTALHSCPLPPCHQPCSGRTGWK